MDKEFISLATIASLLALPAAAVAHSIQRVVAPTEIHQVYHMEELDLSHIDPVALAAKFNMTLRNDNA